MSTIIVTGTYEDIGGTPLNGTVTFTPVATGTDGTVIFLGDSVTAKVQGGALSKSIVTTDTYDVDGAVTYKVVEKVGSTGRVRFYSEIKSTLGSTVDIATLLRFPDPPNQVQLDAGPGEAIDLSSHLVTDHAPITTELSDHETRIDALEAGSAPIVGNHNALLNRNAADGHPTSAITGLDAALAGKQPLDADLTAIGALTVPDNSIIQKITGSWAARTMAQLKTSLGLVKADVGLGNVDNTSDTTKNAATKTLTNTTIIANTTGNVVTGLELADVDGLPEALDAAQGGVTGLPFVEYDEGLASYPNRIDSGTTDPTIPVLWLGGAGPAIGGTGSTGAIGGKDWWAGQI